MFVMPAIETERELTYGEKSVGLTFNPSGDPMVQEFKESFAAIIDNLSKISIDAAHNPERLRLFIEAINKAIDAQMWAVKATTYKF